MARVLNSPIGDLRGSIGGNTFSRNRSGSIVRARTQPVNRNTVAQQRARAAFGQASQAFGALNYTDQSSWNAFAQDGARFNPVNGVNTGQYTGAQAFTSCFAIAQSIAQADIAGMVNLPLYNLVEGEAFVQSNSPALDALYGQIVVNPGTSVEDPNNVASIIDIFPQLYRDMAIVEITLDKDLTVPVAAEAIVDKSLQKIAFALYVSTPVKQNGMRPKREMYAKIMQTPILTLEEVSGASNNIIRLQMEADASQFTLLQELPSIYTLVMQSERGQQKKVFSKFGLPQPNTQYPT